jgi:hypothetical protein
MYDDEGVYCDMCGGPLIFLGCLGKLDWYQCRNCGHECAEKGEGEQ